MFIILENAIISRGYGNNSAIRITQSEKGEIARFSIGKRMYHPRTDDKTKWVNLSVKTDRQDLIDQIKRMQLKEGSWINLMGELKIEAWEDQSTKGEREAWVLYLAKIGYSGGSVKNKDEQSGNSSANVNGTINEPENSPNFVGYSNFNGGDFFDKNPNY